MESPYGIDNSLNNKETCDTSQNVNCLFVLRQMQIFSPYKCMY